MKHRPTFFAVSLAFVSVVLASPGRAGEVWVVDGDGGGDFVDLPEAVESAGHGDTVVVRAGPSYSGFTIVGKSLTVVAEGDGRALVQGPVAVESLFAGQNVLLRGLEARVVAFLGAETHALRDCEGSVWVEDCLIGSGNGTVPKAGVSLHGLSIVDCDAVSIVRSELVGGAGNGAPNGNGLVVQGSAVVLFDSLARGQGHLLGTNGGHGISILDSATRGSAMTAFRTEFRGGAGGIGKKVILPNGPVCGNGGKGGSGVRLDGAASYFAHFDSALVPADGGGVQPGCASSASPGLPGQPLLQLAGAVAEGGPCVPRTLLASSPVVGGDPLELELTGAPGELFVIAYSLGTVHVPILEACSFLQISNLALASSGIVPGGGAETIALATSPGPSGQALTYFLQGFIFDGIAGGLSTPTTTAVYTE